MNQRKPQPVKRSSREEEGGDRGSTAARPTLTRDWGGPQVRDPDLFKRETEREREISSREPDGRVLEARTGNAGEATMAKSTKTVRSAAMMQ